MDLRHYIKSHKQIEKAVELIRRGDLFYQPFIIQDDIEVGEGQNLHDKYKDATRLWDCNAYAPCYDIGERKQPADPVYFRARNQEYREIYNFIPAQISKHLGMDIKDHTFAEIGCNTGLNLFNLAVRGAKSCHGYDWNDMSGVFSWLNSILGTNVRFTRGIYDNLYHRFKDGLDIPEVDVMINTIFTNHQCDPMHFLCYICDRARKGVFLWSLIHTDHPDACIIYPDKPPHNILDKENPFPLYFYNGILMSEKLLTITFHQLGFGEVHKIEEFVPVGEWKDFMAGFRMYYAKRTKNIKSAYWQEPIAKKSTKSFEAA